MYLFIYLIL